MAEVLTDLAELIASGRAHSNATWQVMGYGHGQSPTLPPWV
jgi:hypothetical protein